MWFQYFAGNVEEYKVVRVGKGGTLESTNTASTPPCLLTAQYFLHAHSTNNCTDPKSDVRGKGSKGCIEWVINHYCLREKGADFACFIWPGVCLLPVEYVHKIKWEAVTATAAGKLINKNFNQSHLVLCTSTESVQNWLSLLHWHIIGKRYFFFCFAWLS